MNRSKILMMILMFCSVMLVFYAVVQYVEVDKNQKESQQAGEELRNSEVENAEYRIYRDSLRSILDTCCKEAKTTGK